MTIDGDDDGVGSGGAGFVTTEIVAHRGGAGLWPENSESAFRGSLELGVDQVEFDVQLSADGVPVVFHDATLDRVTDGSGALASRTFAELRGLALFRDGGRIPTLDEVIAILATGEAVLLRCEIKPRPDLLPYPKLIEATVSRIEAAGGARADDLHRFSPADRRGDRGPRHRCPRRRLARREKRAASRRRAGDVSAGERARG